ncbi:hypothetical protein Tco_0058558 [Tanacetum coccineum]
MQVLAYQVEKCADPKSGQSTARIKHLEVVGRRGLFNGRAKRVKLRKLANDVFHGERLKVMGKKFNKSNRYRKSLVQYDEFNDDGYKSEEDNGFNGLMVLMDFPRLTMTLRDGCEESVMKGTTLIVDKTLKDDLFNGYAAVCDEQCNYHGEAERAIGYNPLGSSCRGVGGNTHPPLHGGTGANCRKQWNRLEFAAHNIPAHGLATTQRLLFSSSFSWAFSSL